MHDLEEVLDLEDFSRVTAVFRQLVDELDEQLINIRLARKELFLWDVDKKNLGVDMHPADPICAEHINWYACEPDMAPEFGENRDPEDISSSEAGDGDGGDDDQGSDHDDDQGGDSESTGEDNIVDEDSDGGVDEDEGDERDEEGEGSEQGDGSDRGEDQQENQEEHHREE